MEYLISSALPKVVLLCRLDFSLSWDWSDDNRPGCWKSPSDRVLARQLWGQTFKEGIRQWTHQIRKNNLKYSGGPTSIYGFIQTIWRRLINYGIFICILFDWFYIFFKWRCPSREYIWQRLYLSIVFEIDGLMTGSNSVAMQFIVTQYCIHLCDEYGWTLYHFKHEEYSLDELCGT